MILRFQKTGTFTNAFLGDSFRTEYTFYTLSELPVATFMYVDSNAIIRFNDSTFRIRPVRKFLMGDDYEIFEDDLIIGRIDGRNIWLTGGNVFRFRRCFKSFWHVIGLKQGTCMHLKGLGQPISYEFVLGAKFHKDYSDGKF